MRDSLVSLDSLGLTESSFSSSNDSKSVGRMRAKIFSVTAAVMMTFCLLIALSYIEKNSEPVVQPLQTLSDVNQFETEPAWDANWDIDEFRHHFVQTERMQTEVNKKRDGVIEKLDGEVEEIMKLLKKRPPGPSGTSGSSGPVGPAGRDGNKGATGDAGPNGKNGLPGAPGADGANGPNGRDGIPGVSGPPGQRGNPGPNGLPGLAGRNGIQGLPGPVGQQGPQGIQGPVGPPGGFSGVHVIHHVTNSDYYRPEAPVEDNEQSMPFWQYDEARAQAAQPAGSGYSLSDRVRQSPVEEVSRGEAESYQQPTEQQSTVAYQQPAEEGGNAAAEFRTSSLRRTSSLHVSVPPPPPSQRAEEGYKRRGSIAVSKVDANGYYYLNILGDVSHKLSAVLQGTDGYHRRWQGLDQIYTGPLKAGDEGSKDFLKVQDLSTGETQYFRFKFI